MNRSAVSSTWLFFGTAAFVLVLGVVMLGSATAPIAKEKFGSAYYFFWRQILYGVLPGVALFWIMRNITVRFWERVWRFMLPLSLGLLLLVFVPGLGLVINGSRSWLNLGPWTFQPAELVKLTLIIFLAGWLSQHAKKLSEDFSLGFFPYLCYVGAVLGLLVVQPDVGTMLVFFAACLVLAVAAGAAWKHVGVVILIGLVGLGALALAAPYRMQRLYSFINPANDPLGSGYHVRQALVAIGSGGVLGVGFGGSRQKYQYLPEVSADSIFPVIAEELGFVFAALLIIAFTILVLKGYQLAQGQASDWARYFIIGTVTWIGVQAFLNIGAMLGLLPLTGLPLPLVSHGGSALVVTLASLGVILGIVKPRERRLRQTI